MQSDLYLQKHFQRKLCNKENKEKNTYDFRVNLMGF